MQLLIQISLLINKINLEINRYIELRAKYSDFDDNKDANKPSEKGEFYNIDRLWGDAKITMIEDKHEK